MIVGNIALLGLEQNYLPKGLIKGLEYLAATDFSSMNCTQYEINGTSQYAIVQEYRTQPKETKKAEAHVKYIDIQFVYSGIEVLGYTPANPDAEILEDLTDAKDAIFFKTVPHETDLVLSAGMYAVVFPGEIHRPQCMYKVESAVRKVVLKIAMDILT